MKRLNKCGGTLRYIAGLGILLKSQRKQRFSGRFGFACLIPFP
ncbi:MAG: hypothetical protein WAM85_11320 [Terracidiphilus sp.]